MDTSGLVHLLADLLAMRYSPDELWGYAGPQFSAETSCFAVLALAGILNRAVVAEKYVGKLLRYQRPDGLWPTTEGGNTGSAWATAIAAITLLELSPSETALYSAAKALVRSKPQEAFWLWRLKFQTSDTHVRFDPNKYGWGWVPGNVSWVMPTAMAVIALKRSLPLNLVSSVDLERRVDLGHAMLLDRMCLGGGWNAGNSVVYGVALMPHIDATSLAIAALRFQHHLPEVRQSLSWLLAARCSSAYSLAWKILALRSYLGVRSDVGLALEEARDELVALVQESAQIADNSTLALAILALDEKSNPFAVERAA
jgi:hypothetical protein